MANRVIDRSGGTALELDGNRKNFSVRSLDGSGFCLKGVTGSVEIDGRLVTCASDADAPCLEEREGSLCAATQSFPGQGIAWRWEFAAGSGSIEITARIRNVGGKPLTLGKWNVLHAENADGGLLNLGEGLGRTRFFRWLPWSMRVEMLLSEGGEHRSCNLLHLYNPACGRCLLSGFVTLDRMPSSHTVQYAEASGVTRYRATCAFGEYTLPPGAEIASETLCVGFFDDPYGALEYWADRVHGLYKPGFADLPPTGWIGGWADSFSPREECWEQFALRNAEEIRRKLKGFDVGYIWTSQSNLKDSVPGNWTEADARQIPGGLAGFFEKLAALGFKPGLWVAPFWFYAQADGMLDRCREFLLKDAHGNAVCETCVWGWEYDDNLPWYRMHKYYLDGTHPGTAEYIRELFEYYRCIGVRYYMLDFLGLVENSRLHGPAKTPLQAGCAILRVIREAAGEDTHIQTAVSSNPGYVGLIDAARVGRDFGEGRPLQGGPLSDWRNATHVLHDLHYSNTLYFLQNVAASYFTHRRLYMNDFNLLTIDKPMPLEHARIAVTIFGLGGGSPMMLGDDYIRIDEERLRMVKLCLPRTGNMARPVDLFDHVHPGDYCRVLTVRVERDWGVFHLAAVFNMDEKPYRASLDFASLGLPKDAPCRVWEFWSQEYCGTFRKRLRCEVPPNAVRLYRIEEARSHPWLLSTDLHAQQGAVEVESLAWEEDGRILSGCVTRPAGETGNLFFLMPRKYRLVNHEGLSLLKDLKDMNVIVRLPLRFDRDRVEFRLQFEPWEMGMVVPKGYFPYATEREWLAYVEANRRPGDTRVIE